MGYLPPRTPAPRLNLDRHGMPKDYATYVWLLYRKRVPDDPPRRAFVGSGVGFDDLPLVLAMSRDTR